VPVSYDAVEESSSGYEKKNDLKCRQPLSIFKVFLAMKNRKAITDGLT
jgi:hypothetical protein